MRSIRLKGGGKIGKSATKGYSVVPRGEEMLYSERLNELNLLISPKRRLRDDLIRI